MKIKIISIGNKPPQWVKDAIKSYSDRVENHFKIDWVEIKPEKNFSSIKKKKELEAKKILAQINNDFIICLDENGVDCSSIKLSKNLSLWVQTYPSISFIIGGADGLSDEIFKRANWKWSLSKMTLPHHLVKIILIEQIFRATSILNNHPYHRE